MPQSFASLHSHFIFSTKDRVPLIASGLAPRLYDYIGGIMRNEKGALLAAGGMADHVHLLVSLSRETSIAEMLRLIKAGSSAWVHETFAPLRQFAWQAGYGAFSVSHSNLDAVKDYIAQQAEHHRVRSFQEEFVEFLRRHDIPYDERYLWN